MDYRDTDRELKNAMDDIKSHTDELHDEIRRLEDVIEKRDETIVALRDELAEAKK